MADLPEHFKGGYAEWHRKAVIAQYGETFEMLKFPPELQSPTATLVPPFPKPLKVKYNQNHGDDGRFAQGTMGKAKDMAAAVAPDNKGFSEGLSKVASALGTGSGMGPLKKAERIAQKADSDYEGDVTQVRDAVRGTLVIQNPADLTKYTAEISKSFEITRVKDGFSSAPGYQDAKINVKLPSGYEGEILVAGPEMLEAKYNGGVETNFVPGHDIYDAVRVPGLPSDVSDELTEQMTQLYNTATADQNARIVAGGIGTFDFPAVKSFAKALSKAIKNHPPGTFPSLDGGGGNGRGPKGQGVLPKFPDLIKPVAKYNENHGDDGRFSEGSGTTDSGGGETSTAPFDGGALTEGQLNDHERTLKPMVATIEEQSALQTYASPAGSYPDINGALRGKQGYSMSQPIYVMGGGMQPVSDVVRGMDSLIANNSAQESFIAYRGSSLRDSLIASAKVGGPFMDKGYVSTSLSDTAAKSFGVMNMSQQTAGRSSVTMRITVPQGQNGVYSNKMPGNLDINVNEHEFILPRDTQFTINSIGGSVDTGYTWDLSINNPVTKMWQPTMGKSTDSSLEGNKFTWVDDDLIFLGAESMPSFPAPIKGSIKFNPNHGSDGRFSEGSGTSKESKPYFDGAGQSSADINAHIQASPAVKGTAQEKMALSYYVGAASSCPAIQSNLSSGSPPSSTPARNLDDNPDDKTTIGQAISNMDSLISKNQTSEPILAYRGFPLSDADAANLTVGQPYTNKGYMSVSLDPERAGQTASANYNPGTWVQARVDLPQGTNAVYPDKALSGGYTTPESELILPHGSTFEITNRTSGVNSEGTPTLLLDMSLIGTAIASKGLARLRKPLGMQ